MSTKDTSPVHGQGVPASRPAEPHSWLLLPPEHWRLLHPDGVTLVFELPRPPEGTPTAELPRPPEGATTADYDTHQFIALDGARGPIGSDDSEAGTALSDTPFQCMAIPAGLQSLPAGHSVVHSPASVVDPDLEKVALPAGLQGFTLGQNMAKIAIPAGLQTFTFIQSMEKVMTTVEKCIPFPQLDIPKRYQNKAMHVGYIMTASFCVLHVFLFLFFESHLQSA